MDNMYQVELLNSSDSDLWDAYVKSHAEGTFFHLSGWQRVIEKTFSHACFFLLATAIPDSLI